MKVPAILISFFLFLFVAVPISLAAVVPPASGESSGPTNMQDVVDIIGKVAQWFQMIVLTIAIIMLIAAGFTWMTAGGDEEKLTKARKMLIWGLVGIAVALFAYVAKQFVIDVIGT